MQTLRPRCGAEITPYEKIWGALLEPPVCGRPEGHKGRHRSVQSIRKEKDRQRLHWAEYSRRRRERDKRRQEEMRMRDQLMAAIDRAAAEARERALGLR